MERILNLQKLSESAYGAAGELVSTESEVCSDQTNGCSATSNTCGTNPTTDVGTALHW